MNVVHVLGEGYLEVGIGIWLLMDLFIATGQTFAFFAGCQNMH